MPYFWFFILSNYVLCPRTVCASDWICNIVGWLCDAFYCGLMTGGLHGVRFMWFDVYRSLFASCSTSCSLLVFSSSPSFSHEWRNFFSIAVWTSACMAIGKCLVIKSIACASSTFGELKYLNPCNDGNIFGNFCWLAFSSFCALDERIPVFGHQE